MGLRDRLRRALLRSEDAGVRIPLEGGYATFTAGEMEEALLRATALARGEDVKPHPANVAAANSPDRRWRESFWATSKRTTVAEDLSEGG